MPHFYSKAAKNNKDDNKKDRPKSNNGIPENVPVGTGSSADVPVPPLPLCNDEDRHTPGHEHAKTDTLDINGCSSIRPPDKVPFESTRLDDGPLHYRHLIVPSTLAPLVAPSPL